VNPILGFGGQEVNPTGMIRLPVCFDDKTKFKSLEVDFLVDDVPTTYNVILGRPTLHKVKVVITPYLLQLQVKADDGNVSEMRRDLRTARECYPVSIKPLIERTRSAGPLNHPRWRSRQRQDRPFPSWRPWLSTPSLRQNLRNLGQKSLMQ